ncbi:MAG: phosphotransferase family protein [Gemmatimonadaceae bacterium]
MTSPSHGAPIDAPGPVRDGEALDLAALARYLRERGATTSDAVTVEQFPRGFSNLTYLVVAGDDEFVLRRPPFGVGAGSAHDVLREFRILASLGPSYPFAPRVQLACDDPSVLGAPFYLMDRVRGVILRDRAPAGVVLDAPFLRRLSERFIDALADLHALNVDAIGLTGLGRPDGYVQRQVDGWTRRYAAARTHDHPEVEGAARWLAERIPARSVAALVHNDFKYDNLVLDPADPSRILAVLDWEMATVGDPLLDLGTALAYWVNASDPPELRALGLGLTSLPGNLSRMQLVERYAARSGDDPGEVVFAYVFGLFKVAVIAQQIFARYERGHTRDPRFAKLHLAVGALGRAATRASADGVV